MRVPTLVLALVLAGVCLAGLPAETVRMPLDEVRAGMRAVGVTVFDGAEREEFGVEILGVLTNVMGPQRDIIVARLDGGPLADTGVIQGMSGSPVYIDDRLVGAVSYSLGSFSKDAIAGITPIDEMVETYALALDAGPGGQQARVAAMRTAPLDGPEALQHRIRTVFHGAGFFARRPADVRAVGLAGPDAARLGTRLQRIATPLVLGGFVPEVHELLAPSGGGGGFVTTVGGTMSAEARQALEGQPLQPGDPVGASLVSGDLTMAGTGTVTMVEEGRVYAFGHPFYNLGPARFPMTRAHVTALLPSLAISSKIAAIGEVIGTFDQDRSTGIYGTLGPGPDVIPVTITLREAGRALDQRFSFEVVDDPLFTPILTYTTALNTFFTWTREVGPRTFLVNGAARLEGRPDVTFGDVYTGEIASIAASTALALPLTAVIANEFEPVRIERIEVDVTAVEEPRTATLERVWVDAARPRPGDRIPLHVVLRNYRGAALHESILLDIPSHVSGAVTIEVLDAAAASRHDEQEGRSATSADTMEQLIRNLNGARRHNRLYVRLRRPDAGAVDRGESMPALPGSVLAVLEGDRSGGALDRLDDAPLGEWVITTDHAVSGTRELQLTLTR